MRKIGFRFLAAVAAMVAMASCFEKVVDVVVPEVVAPEIKLEITSAENMNKMRGTIMEASIVNEPFIFLFILLLSNIYRQELSVLDKTPDR